MTEEGLWVVIAVAAAVVALGAALSTWALVRLARDAARMARSGDDLLATLREELPPTLAALEQAAKGLERLAAEGASRVETVDRLAAETEATMAAVGELAGSLNDIVRGPADTVRGVGRSARMMGEGIAHGADRILRVITGADDDSTPPAGGLPGRSGG